MTPLAWSSVTEVVTVIPQRSDPGDAVVTCARCADAVDPVDAWAARVRTSRLDLPEAVVDLCQRCSVELLADGPQAG